MEKLAWNQKLNTFLGLRNRAYFNYLSGTPSTILFLWLEYIKEAICWVFVGAALVLTIGRYWPAMDGGHWYLKDEGLVRRFRPSWAWWGIALVLEGLSVLLSFGFFRVNTPGMFGETFNKISHFEHTYLYKRKV